VVVVNPNNPTGRVIAGGELRGIAATLERQRGLLVVDEAFADFAPEVSLIPELPASAVVLRSFGKAYGLAGLRLGFAVAREGLARRLRTELGPWPVSGPALAIGAAALADSDWLARARERLVEDCQRLDALLIARGFALLGGTHLFRLAQHARARETADSLGRGGILVRRFAAHPTWLRFGVPGSELAWERLARALSGAT
jgi:cobalamin biosynthetic protein CobC